MRSPGRPNLHSVACRLLVVAMAAAMASVPCFDADAGCLCGSAPLDLVFVIDSTGSMAGVIATVKALVEKFIDVVASHTMQLRVGVVTYRTRSDPEYEGGTPFCNLTSKREKVIQWIHGLEAKGGGVEAVEAGIETALRRMNWSEAARKVIVLIGDEAPDPRNIELLYRLGAEAREKGIVINSITASESAWHYFKNSEPDLWKKMVAETLGGEEALKLDMRIPCFAELARIARGRSAGARSTATSIVPSLLSYALGRTVAPDDLSLEPALFSEGRVQASRAGTPGRTGLRAGAIGPAEGTPASGGFLMARLKYAGEWNTPRKFTGLLGALRARLVIGVRDSMPSISLADESCFSFPLLYLCGHGEVKLSEHEVEKLKEYLDGGGTLWADCCCLNRDFDSSVHALVARLLGPDALQPAKPEHELFSIGFHIGNVRRSREHRSKEFTLGPPRVRIAERSGRIVVIYTADSIGAGWAYTPFGVPCALHDEDALKLSVNVVLLAMSR